MQEVDLQTNLVKIGSYCRQMTSWFLVLPMLILNFKRARKIEGAAAKAAKYVILWSLRHFMSSKVSRLEGHHSKRLLQALWINVLIRLIRDFRHYQATMWIMHENLRTRSISEKYSKESGYPQFVSIRIIVVHFSSFFLYLFEICNSAVVSEIDHDKREKN